MPPFIRIVTVRLWVVAMLVALGVTVIEGVSFATVMAEETPACNGMVAIRSGKENGGSGAVGNSLLANQNGDPRNTWNFGGLDAHHLPNTIRIIAPDLLQECVHFLSGWGGGSKVFWVGGRKFNLSAAKCWRCCTASLARSWNGRSGQGLKAKPTPRDRECRFRWLRAPATTFVITPSKSRFDGRARLQPPTASELRARLGLIRVTHWSRPLSGLLTYSTAIGRPLGSVAASSGAGCRRAPATVHGLAGLMSVAMSLAVCSPLAISAGDIRVTRSSRKCLAIPSPLSAAFSYQP